MAPEELPKQIHMDNDGGLYVPSRAVRRHHEPPNPWYTKATHKIKKIRSKNAKENRRRQRAIARTRKIS